MKRKNYKISNLVTLYLNYLFQKTTLIVLLISLLLMIGVLIVLSNPSLDNQTYLLGYNDIHIAFFEQAIFVIQVFNSIILATITISLIINSISFDSLFLSYTPRHILCLSKMIALGIVLLLITLFEVLILFLVPLIRYPLYKFEFSDFKIILFLFVAEVFESMISILLTTLFSTIFMPMTVLFISIVIKALIQSLNNSKDIISLFIPIITSEDGGFAGSGMIIGVLWIVLLTFLYFSVYNIKDLKQN